MTSGSSLFASGNELDARNLAEAADDADAQAVAASLVDSVAAAEFAAAQRSVEDGEEPIAEGMLNEDENRIGEAASESTSASPAAHAASEGEGTREATVEATDEGTLEGVSLAESGEKPGTRPEDRVKDPERFTGHKVRLRVFEGPLDLLLYLVRAHRYDICDIPISEVTNQFIEFIVLMDELDLEYAGEFLVTAATLMQIKARMLLPRHESQNEEELEDSEGNDPRTELVQRLLEYQRYQEAAEALKEMREERAHQFARPPVLDPAVVAAQKAAEEAGETIDPYSAGMLLKDVSTFDLLRALQKVLERQKVRPVTTIRRDPFTLSERVRELGKRIATAAEGISFTDLCEDCQSRLELVITFLSILELISRKRIVAMQDVLFDEIWVRTRSNDER